MAAQSGIGAGSTAANAEARDVNGDIEQALKDRIAEYKIHGFDSSYMEERLQKMVNAKKGRRKSDGDDDAADRDDNADCAVGEQEKQRLAREKGKSAAHKKREGVPDQLVDKSPDPVAQSGPPEDVPDQKSPWPARKVEPAIHQPDLPKEQAPAPDQKAAKPTEKPADKPAEKNTKSEAKKS